MRWILIACVTIGVGLMADVCGGADAAAGKGFGPPAGGKWVLLEAMTDEFEGGKLDAGKWWGRNPTWKGRQPALFRPSNVAVRDGKLHLTMRSENVRDAPAGYHTFTSAAVQSKATVRYGYFEIKCRPMDSRGSSAFWFYRQTPEIWTEIDMFEIGAGDPKRTRAVYTNVHVFHTLVNANRHWSHSKAFEAPFRLADGYHVYALQWDPKELKFSVDGKVVRTRANTHWHQPLTLNFDSETMPKWFGLPDAKNLPSTFSIEYVRSWKRLGGPAEKRHRSCEFIFTKKEAAAGRGKEKTYRIGTAGKGELRLAARHGGEPRPTRVHLEYDEPAFFAAQTAAQVSKSVPLTDAAGKRLVLLFTWEKVKDYKRNNGYRPYDLEIPSPALPKRDLAFTYDLRAAGGTAIRMTVTY